MKPEILSLQKDYEDKKKEINSFFNFVAFLDKNQHLSKFAGIIKHVDMTVLKATCYLVLYNILEPTVNSLVEEALKEAQKHTHYSNIHERVKSSWLKKKKDKIRNCDSQNALTYLKDIIEHCLENKEIKISKESFVKFNQKDASYSALSIKNIFECFNIKMTLGKSAKYINILCDKRNQLAHGERRFYDVGSEVTIQELITLKTNCFTFINPLFKKTDSIITKKLYLAIPKKRKK